MRRNYQSQHNEDSQVPAHNSQRAHNSKLEAHKKIIKITFKLILCISLLNMISLSAFIYYMLKQLFFSNNQILTEQLDALRYMATNLEALPIMDIGIIDDRSTCPYNFEPLKLATWPGTIAGCLCDNGDLFNSTCKKVNSPKCKKEVPETDSIDMYEWEDSIWCIKRAVLRTDYLRQAECPRGYKECYPGGCFKGDCPVTKLEITSSGDKANQFNGKDKYLVSKKSQGELPLINIQITLGDIPCFNQDLSSLKIKNFSYPLFPVKQNKTCGKYGLNNQFSTRLDSQTADESFTQNSFPYVTMHLPRFEENANSTTSILSSMTRMRAAKHDYCLNIDIESIVNLLEGCIDRFGMLYLVLALAIYVAQLFNLFLSALLRWNPGRGDRFSIKEYLSTNRILYALLLITGFGWYFTGYRDFKVLREETEKYDSLKCFEDGQGSLVISDFLESTRFFENIVWPQLGMILFGVSYIWVTSWYVKKMERIDKM